VRNTLRGFLAISPLTAVTVVTALLQNKVLAVALGPAGTGFYALILTFAGGFSTVAGLGISSALMKQISEFGTGDRRDEIWPITILGFATVTAAGFGLLVVVVIAYGPLASAFLSDSLSASDQRFVLVAAAASAIPLAWVPTLSGVLRGLRSLREYVAAALFGAVVPMIGLVVGAWQFDVRGAFIGYILGQMVAVAVGLGYVVKVARDRGIPFRIRLPFHLLRGLERGLVALGLLALIAGLADAIGQPIVRSEIAGGLDLAALGFFAAAWSISNRLPTLIYQTMTAYVLPEISAMRRDWREIVRLQNDACRISLLIATPLLCAVAAAGPWIVPLLFSHSFSPMVELLQLMLIGELLSIVAWAGASALYASGRGGVNIAAEWWFWLVFTVGCVIAVSLGELNAIGGAYILAEGLLATSIYLWDRRHHDFRWQRKNTRLIALSLAALAAVDVLSILTNLPQLVVLILAAVVVAAWAIAVVESSEWIALRRLLARARHGAS
jgi:O-antigen/teichoic acid export membrane protein